MKEENLQITNNGKLLGEKSLLCCGAVVVLGSERSTDGIVDCVLWSGNDRDVWEAEKRGAGEFLYYSPIGRP